MNESTGDDFEQNNNNIFSTREAIFFETYGVDFGSLDHPQIDFGLTYFDDIV